MARSAGLEQQRPRRRRRPGCRFPEERQRRDDDSRVGCEQWRARLRAGRAGWSTVCSR